MTTSTGRRGFVGIDRHWLNNPALSDGALRFMLWLDSHTDEYLRDLSQRRAAKEIGWSPDRVKRTLDVLTGLGLVSVKQVPDERSGNTRTQVTLHQSAWSESIPHDEAASIPHGKDSSIPHGKDPSTSKPIGEESTLELLSQTTFDDDPTCPTFDAWYAIFPKKQGKAEARKRWGKMSGPERIAAWDATAAWNRYAKEHPDGNTYVPMASTWLNQRRWEDDGPQAPTLKGNSHRDRTKAFFAKREQTQLSPNRKAIE